MDNWQNYSQKAIEKIRSPRFVGYIDPKKRLEEKMRLVTALDGEKEDGCQICFYWLVNKEDGMICDVQYQAFGPPILTAISEAICELTLRKSYLQASRISMDLIEMHLRDSRDTPSFSNEAHPYLIMAISALCQAVMQCSDIEVEEEELVTPQMMDEDEEATQYPGWDVLDPTQKLTIIRDVVDKEIRPYIEMDGGGIIVERMQGDRVFIRYEGACTSCFAATGSTLNAIQSILTKRIFPTLEVVPEL